MPLSFLNSSILLWVWQIVKSARLSTSQSCCLQAQYTVTSMENCFSGKHDWLEAARLTNSEGLGTPFN